MQNLQKSTKNPLINTSSTIENPNIITLALFSNQLEQEYTKLDVNKIHNRHNTFEVIKTYPPTSFGIVADTK